MGTAPGVGRSLRMHQPRRTFAWHRTDEHGVLVLPANDEAVLIEAVAGPIQFPALELPPWQPLP